ncbi:MULTISPECIES: efflux transporter outer membrane subunit [unclassified Pseudomonas]|uniref:efflux transporter outer membrane subunit n=1 Tax=unclassified Pseudomonas TaxID=196821 RepID=UPI000BD7F96D|nr:MULTISPECIES: efflux transporter outer membrane subunit [unclassified Pseudomonas]PVZ15284.1 NodT family efflux transporter outer membrane factor (OMF) lipoprotein [Pseudomonas sp. URIL14HWK12:I12]PVZ24658.1 NodT family efflux transporter outer membrane factor (OMF) lipoprotein [Pseudomonas sp. URIL14HWK12:I10]PVZ34503.1 NodT family efflux transporter outer membrane factor (OMF) lipoprotein [Pseudomonas sp. URIL14HWK12:I11]SNZ18869.1 efflux transporter, outer membrane factor (OMF) lipoprotei
MSKPLTSLAASLALVLGGCQVMGPDYHLPQQAAINRPDLQGPLAGQSQEVVSEPVPADWWRLYNDPQLNGLVEQALAANTDLRVAAANLARAQNQLEIAQSQGGFSTSVSGEAQRLQESGQAFLLTEKVPVANIAALSIKTSYQFDMWGVFQRGAEAANANADAAQAAADTARISVVASVVRAYTQVCAANEERAIALRSLDLQQQGVQLAQRLRDAGRGDETQVTRTQTQFKSLRAELPKFEAERQGGLYQLAMLLARPVGQLPAGTDHCAELPHIAQALPVGDGAALLKRRPDVRQAERKLAAATAQIGVATGQLYPDISFGATVGTVGIAEDLGDPSTNRWGFGPLINWTVPTNGARARVRAAEADTQAALARFDGVVLNAVRETQTTLANYTAALERRDALQDAERSAHDAAEQTHRFYMAGRQSFLEDLQATRTYTDVRGQLAVANTQVALQQVNLFLALGGGWQPPDQAQGAGSPTSRP